MRKAHEEIEKTGNWSRRRTMVGNHGRCALVATRGSAECEVAGAKVELFQLRLLAS